MLPYEIYVVKKTRKNGYHPLPAVTHEFNIRHINHLWSDHDKLVVFFVEMQNKRKFDIIAIHRLIRVVGFSTGTFCRLANHYKFVDKVEFVYSDSDILKAMQSGIDADEITNIINRSNEIENLTFRIGETAMKITSAGEIVIDRDDGLVLGMMKDIGTVIYPSLERMNFKATVVV